MQPRKREAVLTSARELFLAKGFAATTVEEVADGAHVSKATVYNNFADKAAVLRALLDRVASESAAILAAVVAPLHGAGPVEDRLAATAAALTAGVLRPEVLALRRLAVAESVRFPTEVADYFERGPGSSVRLLAEAFRALAAEGVVAVPDPELAAAQFAYAVVGPLQDRALLTGATAPREEVERHARAAARAFLAAHRPG